MEKKSIAFRAPAKQAVMNLWLALGFIVASYVLTIVFMEGKTLWILIAVISLLLVLVLVMLISFFQIPRVSLEEDDDHLYLHFRASKKDTVLDKKDLLVASAILATGGFNKTYTYGTLVLMTAKENYALPWIANVKDVADALPTVEKRKGKRDT